MKKTRKYYVLPVMGLLGAMLAFSGANALGATTTNLTVTPASPVFDGNNTIGVPGDAAPGYASGSIASGGASKSDMYFAPGVLFGRDVTLSEVAKMSYWTKKGTTHVADPRDWFLAIYTKPYVGDVSTPSWYGDRIGSEPYFSDGLAESANDWNQWTTDGPVNKLRFFESTQGAPGATFGSYTDPDWATFKGGNALSGYLYGDHQILFWSIQTGSAWAAGFNGLLDGFRIELTDGSVATVNFEPFSWKGQYWDLPLNGTATIDDGGNLVLIRTVGTDDVAVHVNRIAPVDGSGNSWINQNGTPWIQFSYIDNGQSKGVDMFIDNETAPQNPRLQAGSLFSLQGLGYTRFGPGVYPTSEEVVFAEGAGSRLAGQLHTIYVGQRADGTIDYNYDGTWFTSTFQKDAGVAPFDFNDVLLRLRGNSGTSATFTDFQYGDDHAGPPRQAKIKVAGELIALLDTITDSGDRSKLQDAISHLSKSVSADKWLDDSHPKPGSKGEAVFNEEEKTVNDLKALRDNNHSGIPAATLQGHINLLLWADRQIAERAIAEAIANPPYNAGKISTANSELSKGDVEAAKDHPDKAIDHYKNAWKNAIAA
jgi:hypothetical protein